MKFSRAILSTVVLASARRANAFAPAMPKAGGLISQVNAPSTFRPLSYSALDTGLNLFGFGKKDSTAEPITEAQVRDLFSVWNNALASGDSRLVAKRYAKDGVLLPTVSDVPRTDFNLIKDYFDAFLLKKPQGKIVDGHIKIGHNWAQDAGIYEFTLGVDGSKVMARYSFVYTFEGGQWRIAHHHSSVMPEGIASGKTITEGECRGLFHLWNDALATLDSDAVAKRYSKNGVLLPTVSDKPRTNYAAITDYFDAFLLKKPQGKIISSNVITGLDWCQDAGIYEFTMGDGAVVKARYSFIYVWEDGEWKISHHHSSVMPEGIPASPATITKGEVQGLFQLWNDALATGDPKAVTDRYAKDACLLPTVSDTPRTTPALITDYFTAFLKKKPQGVITESNVIMGHNWAQDAGIYEFTMGADGSKVKARYSFIYVFEDGQWKISHHHSSQMPEEIMPIPQKEKAFA